MKSLPIPAMKSVEGTQPIRKHYLLPLQNMVEQKKDKLESGCRSILTRKGSNFNSNPRDRIVWLILNGVLFAWLDREKDPIVYRMGMDQHGPIKGNCILSFISLPAYSGNKLSS